MAITRQEVLDAFQAAIDAASEFFLENGGDGEDGDDWEDIDPGLDELRSATSEALDNVDRY